MEVGSRYKPLLQANMSVRWGVEGVKRKPKVRNETGRVSVVKVVRNKEGSEFEER